MRSNASQPLAKPAACIYALLGKKELALEFLKNALQKGYRDIQDIKKDPDLETLRADSNFRALVDSYR